MIRASFRAFTTAILQISRRARRGNIRTFLFSNSYDDARDFRGKSAEEFIAPLDRGSHIQITVIYELLVG